MTLTLIPSKIAVSIASTPSAVPGILIITFGRETSFQYLRADAIVPAVSRAKSG